MLVALSDVLMNADRNQLNSNIHFLDLLRIADDECKHIIFCEPHIIQFLIKNFSISNESRSFLKRLDRQWSMRKSLLEKINTIMYVVSEKDQYVSYTQSNKHTINCPYFFISNTTTIQEPHFLAEHITDTKYYEYFINLYIHYNNLSTSYNFETLHGGGDSIADVYHDKQNSNDRLCFCVTDSDKTYPNSSLGQVARKVKRNDSDNYPLTTYIFTDGKSIENYISYSLIKRLKDEYNSFYSRLFNYVHNIFYVDAQYLLYLDLKKVNVLRDKINPSKPNMRNYWYNLIIQLNNMHGQFNHCLISFQCIDRSHCSCYILEGNNNLLKNIVDFLSTQNIEFFIHNMDDYLFRYIYEVGHTMFSWFCAHKNLKTAL